MDEILWKNTMQNWFNYGGDLSLLKWVNEVMIQNVWGRSPTRINIHYLLGKRATNLADQDSSMSKEFCALQVLRLAKSYE